MKKRSHTKKYGRIHIQDPVKPIELDPLISLGAAIDFVAFASKERNAVVCTAAPEKADGQRDIEVALLPLPKNVSFGDLHKYVNWLCQLTMTAAVPLPKEKN